MVHMVSVLVYVYVYINRLSTVLVFREVRQSIGAIGAATRKANEGIREGFTNLRTIKDEIVRLETILFHVYITVNILHVLSKAV